MQRNLQPPMRTRPFSNPRRTFLAIAATALVAVSFCPASEKDVRIIKTNEGDQFYEGETPSCSTAPPPRQPKKEPTPGPNSVALKASVYWKSSRWKDGLAPFAEETVTIRVHKVVDETRLVDFEIEILALEEDLRIGGSNDVKGYSGFSTRIILPAGIQMRDPDGRITPQNTAVAAGEWMNFSGTFGETTSNFAILVPPPIPAHLANGSCESPRASRMSRTLDGSQSPFRL